MAETIGLVAFFAFWIGVWAGHTWTLADQRGKRIQELTLAEERRNRIQELTVKPVTEKSNATD